MADIADRMTRSLERKRKKQALWTLSTENDLVDFCSNDFLGFARSSEYGSLTLEPSYTLQAKELYVRARVDSSVGTTAWTQPLFAEGKGRFE